MFYLSGNSLCNRNISIPVKNKSPFFDKIKNKGAVSNLMKAEKVRKSYFRPVLIGAAIFSVLVLHFAVSQFIAYQERENDVSVGEPVGESSAIIDRQEEAKKPETTSAAENISPPIESDAKIEAGRQIDKQTETVNRKKAPRESRAERLRRAERILTGI